MADRQLSGQPGDHLRRVQGVADFSFRAVHVKMLAVVGDDAGGFLSAVLQGVQAQRRQRGGILVAEDAEDAAFLAQLVVVERVRRLHRRRPIGSPARRAVTGGHRSSCRRCQDGSFRRAVS